MSYFRYVRLAEIDDYTTHGWRLVCPLQGHHGVWSVLMEYVGEGVGP